LFFATYKTSQSLLLLTVQWVIASKTVVSVERIGASRLHVVLVIEPDVISLLATKDSECSADDDSCDDDNCQQTGRDTDDSIGRQSKNAGLSVSIADLACIDLGAWNLINEASISGSGAESNVTSSLLLVDGG